MTTRLLTTGGTIDAVAYDGKEAPERVTPNQPSMIPRHMEQLGIDTGRYQFQEVCHKDSKDLNEGDIAALVQAIADSPEQQIVVTMGTDGLADFAREVSAELVNQNIHGKTVVFTGAMRPLSSITGSDGYSNLNYIDEKIGNMSPGVHVVMHAREFDLGTVRKDTENKMFIDGSI